MSFTIEFQPTGIRLVCEEALTILDAARQAGLMLRSDCGGQGTCGKCRVQIAGGDTFPISASDRFHLSSQELTENYRLACAALAESDLKVFIPAESLPAGQVLQTAGQETLIKPDPAVRQAAVSIPAPDLQHPSADFERLRTAAGNDHWMADLQALRALPRALRDHPGNTNLILRGQRLQHITPSACRPLVGLAVDVGSTKLACYLIDLESGLLLAARGIPNPQIRYGEDIMARLAFALKGTPESRKLHEIVMAAIQQAAEEMCRQVGISAEQIADACLVGNTAMQHFFLDLPTASLAVSPFVPVTCDPLSVPADQINLKGMSGMQVYAPPVIAGFVGSDHLAFLFSAGFGQDERTRLGIDIGTNTEIALQKGGRVVSVSTASGPAFEGAHIRCGMRAAPGAIEHVRLLPDRTLQLDVIGEAAPAGVCGSGILDALGEMRAAGMFNRRGRLDKSHPLVKVDGDGMAYFQLSNNDSGKRPVTLSQGDIDQVLLAKGAIRAGIEVLMDHLKVTAQEIDEVLIAGAFGSYMLPEQAIRIGMLPPVALEKIRALGNAAGAGARQMLVSMTARRQAEGLARRIEYLELSLYPDFDLFFARGIQA